MNFNKLTVKAQEAVAEGQNLARGAGNPELTPEHLLLALLRQDGGIVAPILNKLGLNPGAIEAEVASEVANLEGRRCVRRARHLQLAAQGLRRSFQARRAVQRRVRLDRALPAGSGRRSAATQRRLLAAARASRRTRCSRRCRRCAASQRVTDQNPEDKYQALEHTRRDLTELARARQARSGHRPRRGDPPRHPGALAPHEEQPGADRRAGRRQDRHRRRAGAAHRRRATCPRG